MSLIQKLYCTILNPCYAVINKIPEKTRTQINFVCVLLVVLLAYYGEAKDYMKGPPITTLCILQSILLMIITLMSMNGPLRLMKWSKLIPWSWFLFSIIVILTGFDHVIGPGFRPMAIVMLLFYPLLFFVWSNRGDYQMLFDMVAKSTVIVGLAFFVACMFYNPLTEEVLRYTGFTGNPGSLGKIGVAVLTCGLYLVMTMRRNYWLYALFSGLACTLIILSLSRTALLAMCALLLFLLLFCIKEFLDHREIRKKLLVRILAIVLMLVIAYPTTNFLLENGYAILQETYHVSKENKNGAPGASNSTDVNNQQTEAATDTIAERQKTQDVPEGADKEELTKERVSLEGKDLNSFSTGRLAIYKARIALLNWKGNDATDSIYAEGYGRNRWSHNTVLEFAYRSGIIAGGLFFLIELLSAIYVFRKLFSREKVLIYQYFVFFAIIGFGIMSLTDVIFTPAADPGVLYYFLAMMPLFCRKSKKKE
ncbi:O-antigen ligase family protein [Ihubacter massiliensis]|uniref:O-antigen ligase family protein n=1 Tax=Hominibacterium faecale TaxID=2839743 RepID=A0A9J6QW35_9FIRM|nr:MULTISPECIES: O-antigen ligase family protein [Eubacteriales Family XIII. Incertae Sedis]MCC2864725.1 O-antigen ligase family protein [Anaerovorax odorimutans]MCO7123761.1 O-antigen ligase family protein [Ihubacter massiliensis]MCU7378686.1 O-antigen ligase family protein [Hominibacterium faecale]